MTARLHITAADQHLPYTPRNDDIDDKVVPEKSRKHRLDLSSYSPAVQRFWADLPETTRALGRPLTPAEERRGIKATWALWKWSPDWADRSVSGVHVNTPKWARWVVADVDHTDIECWRSAGFPAPMKTIVNGPLHPDPRKRGRHHHLWELREPVILGETGRQAPQTLLRLVQLGVAFSLDADMTFAASLGGATKNPLNPAYEVIEWPGARAVSLGELAAHADIDLALERANGNGRPGRALADQPDGSRHKLVFEAVRHDAYAEVRANWDHYHTTVGAWTSLKQLVLGWLEAANAFPDPLPRYDLEATAKSIARFCQHRLRPRKADVRRPGRGKLREAVAGLTLPEKQAVGARHSSADKAAAVRARVETAVASLMAEGLEVSPGAVGARANCDRKTARRHLANLSIPSAEGGAFGVHQMNGKAAARPCAGRPRPETHGMTKNTLATTDAVPAGGCTGMENTMEDGEQTLHGTAERPAREAPLRRVARWRQFEVMDDVRADECLARFRAFRPPDARDAEADRAVPW